ncbi:hypothetical protein [Euryhalocaulis caribicus]|uniref:hypothetical protein n=1 Tax=Euryhalocaulis caribicus TaxID=1161401 RepID=UPI0012690AE4|nr:hypothetical protein [Euryhalocaulis caribicus]
MDDLVKGLPTSADVRKWEEASARLGSEIDKLSEQKERVDRLIERAKLIFEGEFEPSPASLKEEPETKAVQKTPSGRMPRGIWTSSLKQIADDHPSGISYERAKELLPESLQEQIAKDNTKAFYGALRRLEQDEHVVRFNSHIFTPEGFEKFKGSSGYKTLAKKGSATRGSPISDALKSYLAEAGPSKALAIKEHLCRDSEFRGPLKRNNSYLHNILRRLVEREEVHHDRENALYSLVEKKEPPRDERGGSESGEDKASSKDSRSLFRVVG